MIVSRLLKGQMRDNKRKPIGELIDVWNYVWSYLSMRFVPDTFDTRSISSIPVDWR
jgi:hypothetical protein